MEFPGLVASYRYVSTRRVDQRDRNVATVPDEPAGEDLGRPCSRDPPWKGIVPKGIVPVREVDVLLPDRWRLG